MVGRRRRQGLDLEAIARRYRHHAQMDRGRQEQAGEVTLPEIPGVNTVAGRVVLDLLKRNVQQQAKAIMDDLIKANEEIRQQLRATTVGTPA